MESRSRSKTPARKRTRAQQTRSKTPGARRNLSYGARNARVVAAVGPTVGLGTSLTTNLRTSFFSNILSNASGIWTGYLKPGSAYDPTGDVAAIQPALFDQYSAVFARYVVNKFTVKITILGARGENSNYTWNAAAYPSVDSTAMTTYQAAASQPWAKTVIGTFSLYWPGSNPSVGVGTNKEIMYFKNISNAAVVGTKQDAYDMGAVIGADPPAGQYAVMPIFIQNNSASQSSYVLHVDIWQNVTFNQRKPVSDA